MRLPSDFDREKFENQIQSWLSPMPNNELGILLHLVHAEKARRKKQAKRRQRYYEQEEIEKARLEIHSTNYRT